MTGQLLVRMGWAMLAVSLAAPSFPTSATVTSAPVGASPVDPKVAEALTDLRADGSYQFSFPEPDPPPPVPDWLKGIGQALDRFFIWLGGDGNVAVQAIAYALIAIALLFVLYLTVPAVRETIDRWLRAVRRQPDAGDDQPDWQPDAAASRNLLAEADALAAAGHYGEAAHLLLGRSIEDIASRRPGLLKPALTARAIALVQDLPAAARDAFARIAAAVERSLWARRAIDLADWQAARAAYEEFAFGSHWRDSRT
jgi:type IV secretory pathway VirB3-like protein